MNGGATAHVHDHVLTPYGEAVVDAVDWQKDTILVQDIETGVYLTFGLHEVEEMPAAPVQDDSEDYPERLEQWLRCTAAIVPAFQVQDDLVRCNTGAGCECDFCYSIERTISRRGLQEPRTKFTHMRDSEICTCITDGCGCVVF